MQGNTSERFEIFSDSHIQKPLNISKQKGRFEDLGASVETKPVAHIYTREVTLSLVGIYITYG